MKADVIIETDIRKVLFRDNLNWAFGSRDIYKSAALVGVFLFVLSFGLSFSKETSLLSKLIYAGFSAFVTSACVFLLTLVTMTFCLLRLKPEQKQIKWEFTESDVKLMDSTGLVIITPWSQIKNVTFKKTGVCFYAKPRGSRWLPTRFLTREQHENLRLLVSGKLQ